MNEMAETQTAWHGDGGEAVIVHPMHAETGPNAPITIVIADDHQVVRAGLRLLLEAEDGFQVLAEAGDVPTTERRLTAYHPRVLILDLNMPGESSLARDPADARERPGYRDRRADDAERPRVRAGGTARRRDRLCAQGGGRLRTRPGGQAGRRGPDLSQPRARRSARRGAADRRRSPGRSQRPRG